MNNNVEYNLLLLWTTSRVQSVVTVNKVEYTMFLLQTSRIQSVVPVTVELNMLLL